MEKHSFSIKNIPTVWLALGCLAFCAAILLGVITIARPFIKSNTANATVTTNIIAYSSDSASLYPPEPPISLR